MSEPPNPRPAPQAYPPQTNPPQTNPPQTNPPQTNPPQSYPPQNYPPQSYPPQNYPPQNYPPQNHPPQNPQSQPYPLNPAAPYPAQPHYRPARRPSEELRRDSEAALAARMELGPEYNEYVAAGLAERVEEIAEVRAAELRQQVEQASRAQAVEQGGRGRQFALAIVSLVMGIPITGITASEVDPAIVGVAISWAGIVGVNWVHARAIRKRK
jgi:hypothetical protein